MQKWTEEVLEPNKTFQNLWQGQKAVLTIVEFDFFDIFYSKFQLVSTFSICTRFCIENWLFCCDVSCKWVTCRSGCKRFWKSALHMWNDQGEWVTCRQNWFWVTAKKRWHILCFTLFRSFKEVHVSRQPIADVANSKRHQRLDQILIIFTHTIQEISKVVCKKTISETRAFITSLSCMKRAHYSKRMLRKQDCVKFCERIAWQSFLKTTLLISPM